MKIFKLVPKNLNSPDWGESNLPEKVIVRAEDENKARRIAAFSFAPPVEIKSRVQPSPINPWESSNHVDCKEETDSKYSIDGDEEILDPNPSDF